MSVHYKFKSALEYDTVTFDGLHISVKDLKNAIVQQKRIGKNTDFDLQVTNAQTKEVYEDENVLIPKNTSLLIARIPTSAQTKTKQWEGYGGDATPPTKLDEGPIAKAVDLSSLDAPEDDKIKAMISQSTQDYDPSNYMKIRGANQMGAVPANYRCYKCHQTGHWIKDCPLSKGPEPIEIKKSTGIPLSFMVPVEGPQVQGAMMTPNGSYAVPVLDHQTYTQKQTAPAPVQEVKPEIPEDLLCSICSDLLTDAVMIPCCGNSFCDECIRSFLLESEEHECPDCHEKDISPATLIPNRFLRNSVANFKNTTGYVKKPVYKQGMKRNVEETVKEVVPEQKVEVAKVEQEEKTVISEADSTEHSKNEEKEAEVKRSPITEPEALPEGPPGVSPVESPKTQSISKRVNSSREPRDRSSASRPHKHRSRDESPRRHHRNHRNSPFRESGRAEERAGTPTVDEPGVSSNSNYPPPDVRPYTAPPMMGMVPPMQGPPPNMPPGFANPPAPMGSFPPTNGPPPNFRMPPPGAAPPYLPPGPYQVPPRPMFDATRPPMTGPPPMYNPSYQGSRSHHRDYGMSDRRMRGRTPSGRTYRVIDDPLAAFNRMLREKDERERRAKRQRRSYSRSRSRSRSYSRSPRRMRSRSPRRRQSRSRSRSFSISRSRSRSFSGSMRGSPFRDFSPRHSPPRRRGPSRYRSPLRSPPRHRFKDSHQFRDRDYDHERDRDYGREDRGYSRDREHRGRDDREGHNDRSRDREYGFGGGGYDNYDDRSRGKGSGSGGTGSVGGWGQPRGPQPPQDAYYQAAAEMQQHPTYHPPPNRYPPRDYQPYGNKEPHVMPPAMIPARRYEDVPPPGVEEPPIPGLENTRFEDRFDRFPSPGREPKREEAKKEKKKHENRIGSPEKKRSPSVRRKSKSKEKDSPEKHKRKKREPSAEKDKKIVSDEEKSKKSKDRKKKKEKKDSDKKKRKDKKEKHKEKKHKDEVKEEVPVQKEEEEEEEAKRETPEVPHEEQKADLYDDMLSEGVDTNVMENYGKMKETSVEKELEEKVPEKKIDEEVEVPKDYEDEEKDILEIHPTDIDLKTELDVKNEMLAHLPEKSKWEVEEDITPQSHTSPKESGRTDKPDKTGKVTNEVLKRAENAIFAKAINAIRPIEIKKISTDRAKLYSGEREEESKDEESEAKNVPSLSEEKGTERKKVEAPSQPPVRLSVKERLGIKIDDIDRIVKVDRNKSRSISPFSRRDNETYRNYALGERRVEVVDRRRRDRSRHRDRGSRRDFRREDFSRRDRRERTDPRRRDEKRRERSKSKSKAQHEEEKKEKKKRSRSRSESEESKEKRKRKEKKVKKEKTKKHKEEEGEKKEEEKVDEAKTKTVVEKRKPTIDEANFEPDYDLESESEKEDKKEKKGEEKKSSSSSESSDSSSDDEKTRKKHKKHRKKRSRKDSSSSSSESETESSDEDKERKRKKHKRKQKKRKKSKHK